MKTVTFFLYSWIKSRWYHHPLIWSDPKFWSQHGLDSFPLSPLPQIAWISKTCQLDLQITVWLHLLLSFNTATSSKTSPAAWISTVGPRPQCLPCGLPTGRHSTHACVLSRQVVSESCNPMDMDCSPPGSTDHGISQVRIPERVTFSFSRGSSRHRDWISISYIGRWILYHWATWEVPTLHIQR